MKKTCMNYQQCSYYKYLTPEEVKDSEIIDICPECNSLTVLTKNDFNIRDHFESIGKDLNPNDILNILSSTL